MWGWGGVVCCHLLDFNHIHIVFLCVCVAQTTFIIYTQTGNLGRAPHGRLAHHARHPSPAFEEGEGRPWRREGEGRGKGGEKGGVEDPLPRLHLQGWPLDPAVTWSVTSSCQPWESQGVNSGLRSGPILEM